MAESIASTSSPVPEKARRPRAACELCGVTCPPFQLTSHPTRDYQGAQMVVWICRDPQPCLAAADAAHVARLARRDP